jgi:hypothetical protein
LSGLPVCPDANKTEKTGPGMSDSIMRQLSDGKYIKSEIRISKSETNPNGKGSKLQTHNAQRRLLRVLGFGDLDLFRISSFGFRDWLGCVVTKEFSLTFASSS